jgi:thiol-disulfide isomerase/thioredoxin
LIRLPKIEILKAMKKNKYLSLMLGVALLTHLSAAAQTATVPNAAVASETDPVKIELNALVEKVKAKLKTGMTTEAGLADEIKGFDNLIAKNSKASPDTLAQVALLKAMLYLQVFEDTKKGSALLQKIKTDYPTSKLASKVDGMLAQITKRAEAKKVQSTLTPGAAFPDFNVASLTGQPLSVAALKGKVVLVDFWATWCGPCRAELPNVIATYQKFHGKGFEVIGVSLDSDRAKLEAFLKKQDGMVWPQFFDGQGWSNQLAVKYGVESIPFTVLVGTDGKIIGTELRGEALGAAVEKALAKK